MLRPARLLHQSRSIHAIAMRLKGAHGSDHVSAHEESGCSEETSTFRSSSRDLERFFFSHSNDAKRCRLCGDVAFHGMAHTGSPLHLALESFMWLIVDRASKHSSGAVGVSPEAARAFFVEETRRWKQVLSCCAGSPVSSMERTGGEVHASPSDSATKFGDVASGDGDDNNTNEGEDCRGVPSERLWCHAALQKASQLRDTIHTLGKLGVLSITTPRGVDGGGASGSLKRDVGFQRMECIGDHNWGHSICHRLVLLFPEVQWRTRSGIVAMDAFRTVLESNHHLDDVFTQLRLDDIISGTVAQVRSSKLKADMVEAVAGELHVALWSLQPHDTDGITMRPSLHGVPLASPLAALVRRCLDDLLDLVILCFMAKYNAPLVQAIVQLCRREQYMMDCSSPFYRMSRTRQRRPWGGVNNTQRTLPPLPPLLPHRILQKRRRCTHTCIDTRWSLSSLLSSSSSFSPPTTFEDLCRDEPPSMDTFLCGMKRQSLRATDAEAMHYAVQELIDQCTVLKTTAFT